MSIARVSNAGLLRIIRRPIIASKVVLSSELLLEHSRSANPNARDRHHKTPLDLVPPSKLEVARILLEHHVWCRRRQGGKRGKDPIGGGINRRMWRDHGVGARVSFTTNATFRILWYLGCSSEEPREVCLLLSSCSEGARMQKRRPITAGVYVFTSENCEPP